MRKKIYFCQVTIVELKKRGKTVNEGDSFKMKLPTKSLTIEEFLANSDDMMYIVRNLYGKGKIEDNTKHFLDNYRIKSVIMLKEIGETIDLKEEDKEDDWV